MAFLGFDAVSGLPVSGLPDAAAAVSDDPETRFFLVPLEDFADVDVDLSFEQGLIEDFVAPPPDVEQGFYIVEEVEERYDFDLAPEGYAVQDIDVEQGFIAWDETIAPDLEPLPPLNFDDDYLVPDPAIGGAIEASEIVDDQIEVSVFNFDADDFVQVSVSFDDLAIDAVEGADVYFQADEEVVAGDDPETRPTLEMSGADAGDLAVEIIISLFSVPDDAVVVVRRRAFEGLRQNVGKMMR